MKKLVLAYIQKLHMLEQNDCVVVGLSGGADSVCLLYLLHELQEELGISLEAVHIHHGLRPEADDEAEFAEKLCTEWGIPYRMEKIDVTDFQKKNGLGTEEAARLLRYEIFEKEIQKGAKIALAHHKNDQAETVLFHLFRGSSLRGLCGIQPVRGRIVRPLLCVTRDEIEAFLNENNLSYVTDQSNYDTAYARNLIRHEIMPLAEEKICSGATEHISAEADSIRLALDYLDEEAGKLYGKTVVSDENGSRIDKAVLKDMHPYMKSEILYRMLVSVCGKQKDISRVHIDALLDLLDAQSGKSRNLIYGTCAYTDQHQLFIRKEEDFLKKQDSSRKDNAELSAEIIFDDKNTDTSAYLQSKPTEWEQQIAFGKWSVTFRIFPYNKEKDIPCGNYTKWFDYDKINTTVSVRYRKSGDYFFCTGESKKKVQDYMVDQKIPAAERNRIPLVTDGNHVLWMIGYRISEFYKVTDETKYILEIAAEKGE